MPTATLSSVIVPVGWPSIRMAYDRSFTTKLNQTGTMVQKLAAIGYWQQRLVEDASLIKNNQPPATTTTTTIPYPNVWPDIRATYTIITNKLNDAVPQTEKLIGIGYWQQRLVEDKALIQQGQPPATTPPPPPP